MTLRILPRARRVTRRPRGPRATEVEFEQAVVEFFMRLAIREARKGLGRTSPNPAVGALLVKNGRVVARGHHARAGGPHAEVVALQAAGELARGADLFTTLEPCDHHGRTPPCTRAILAAGVRRVFVGSRDPNPLVSGRGVRRLRRAGLAVVAGVLDADCDRLNESWFRFISSGRPYVTLKAAMTLDGRIATATGDSRWITGPEARARVHELRDRVDAVIVGSGTVAADDPLLTARLPGERRGRDPLRVVLSSRLALPPRARVLALGTSSSARTVLACTAAAPEARRRRLAARPGVEVLVCRSRRGRVDVADLLARLAGRGVVEVLVEGGAEVFGAFLEAGLADRVLLFVGPKVLGGGPAWTASPRARKVADALHLELSGVEQVGADALLDLRPAVGRARPRRARRRMSRPPGTR